MSASDRTFKVVPAADRTGYSLPAWTYDDPTFMQIERERVFLPAWQLVCHVNDIPNRGDYATLRLYGERGFVVRQQDGSIRAFHNVCRHRAARLVDGHQGNCGGRIVCPYHAWTFKLDGALIGVPNEAAYENFSKADHGLVPIECEVFAGFVFIRFVPGGESLATYMEPIAEETALYRFADVKPMRKIGERLREVNWKNAMDNYCDALHIPVAHDGLNNLIGETYRLEIDRGVYKISGDIDEVRSDTPSNHAYKSILPRVDHLPESRQRLWTYYKLWPSLAFDVYPDQIDFMQFLPLGPTSCLLRESVYALDDTRREMQAARYLNLRINRVVNREDHDLISRVQDGMGSSVFDHGPLGSNEICLRDFANRMRATIPLAAEVTRPSRDRLEAALGT